jgi:DNA-binding response OmpR family regulator
MKTILIVDDEEDIRNILRVTLLADGFSVLEAENGEIALGLAREKIPDLIISDVMMENVNGFMLFEFLREDTSTEKIPIILVTGKAQSAGAWETEPGVAYLQKPLAPDELLAAVRRMLKL